MADQLTDTDLHQLYVQHRYDEIEDARAAGRLDALLGVPPTTLSLLDRANGAEPLTRADVRALSALGRHDLITEANRAGRITPEGA